MKVKFQGKLVVHTKQPKHVAFCMLHLSNAQSFLLMVQETGYCAGKDTCHWAHDPEELRLDMEGKFQGKPVSGTVSPAPSVAVGRLGREASYQSAETESMASSHDRSSRSVFCYRLLVPFAGRLIGTQGW